MACDGVAGDDSEHRAVLLPEAWEGVMGGRVSGFIGRALIGLCFLLATVCGQVAHAQPYSDAGAGQRLFYIETDLWQTDLTLTSIDANGASLKYSNCSLGYPGADPKVTTDQVILLENYGHTLCGPRVGITKYKLTGSGAVSTFARFRDAGGYTVAFEVPPLTTGLPNSSGAIDLRPIQNDATRQTHLILFNEGLSPTSLSASVYDGAGELVAVEAIAVQAGDFTFYQLRAPVRVGRESLSRRPALPWVGQALYLLRRPAAAAAGI